MTIGYILSGTVCGDTGAQDFDDFRSAYRSAQSSLRMDRLATLKIERVVMVGGMVDFQEICQWRPVLTVPEILDRLRTLAGRN